MKKTKVFIVSAPDGNIVGVFRKEKDANELVKNLQELSNSYIFLRVTAVDLR